MGIEYKIKFKVPAGYDPLSLEVKLPSPVHADSTWAIYSYSLYGSGDSAVEGFCFVDNLVDKRVASHALRLLIDEALRVAESVEIVEA